MRIAACDDDNSDLAVIKDFVNRFDAGLSLDVFNDAEELLRAIKTTFYDLIFLDIEMHELNGFDAAKLIMGGQEKPLIIFVTKSSKYTIQGYEVAFRYLVKPLDYDDFMKVMTAAMDQIVPQKIAFDVNGREMIFSVRDIYYFEIYGHRVRIKTAGELYICRNSLKNIEDMVDGCSFVRAHNSYLVNIEHIAAVSQTELVMKDGLKVSISRKKKDLTVRLIYQYLRR